MEATANIYLETTRKTKDSKHAVKLRVTYKGTRKYYSIKPRVKNNDWLYLTVDDFKEIMAISPKKPFNAIRTNFDRIKTDAEEIIQNISIFSFGQFEQKFLNKNTNWDYVSNAFLSHIEDLKAQKRYGYAVSIQSTFTAIKYYMEGKPYKKTKNIRDSHHADFARHKRLKFVDITSSWLKKYEQYLVDNGKSRSTIGIHGRNIKTLFNLAIKTHKVIADYPFNDYVPKKSSNKKRALQVDKMAKIMNIKLPEKTNEQFARDMFIFSFLAYGMNITDILRLKYFHIKNNFISFDRREKTKNELETQTETNIPIVSTMQEIIDRWGNSAINKNVYIFPVLSGINDEQKAYSLIKQANHNINDWLKKIAKKCNLPPEISNSISHIYARHSFATILKNTGKSIEFIQEALKHGSKNTTQKYLGSFEDDTKIDVSKELETLLKNAI